MDYDEFMDSINFLAVSRAYKILKLYSETEEKSGRLKAMFDSWLMNSHNEKEKDIALRMVFEETANLYHADDGNLVNILCKTRKVIQH